ncbi:ATP-binding protein [Acidobacteria bacterium AH-259-D05]|nr:ATP-binding protein [Acidobacteria bacterium AH-259-D05]
MIQYTLENNIVLYLFETLLTGLLLLILIWEYVYAPRLSQPYQAGWVAAFLSLSGFSAFKCLYAIVLSTGTPWPEFRTLSLFVPGLESLFILCLLVSVAKWGRFSPYVLVTGFLLLTPLGLFFSSEGPFERLESPYPMVLLNCLLMGCLLVMIFTNLRLRGGIFQVGVAFFVLSYLCGLFYLLEFLLPFWSLQHVTKLLGLFCFALHLEREQEHIFVQFFIRLNLVFILSAGIFMLILSDAERKTHLKLSATAAQELGEFLRGHAVFYYRQGNSPRTILESDPLNDKVVSEFGRIPTLKEVRVELLGNQLRMAIDDDGMISYERGEGLFVTDRNRIYDYERNTITIISVPIVSEGKQLGVVELGNNLLSLTQQISGQMRFTFISFTVIVLFILVSLGLVVARAHRIIQQQYQKLSERDRELMQASQLAAVGQLVDGVAHEVNNPTGVILIRSECALASSDFSESVREDLLEIRSQATRMSKIVRNLLAFSRPKPIRIVSLDLNELINRSMVFLNSYQQMVGIETRLDLDPSLPAIPGDADRLEQVIINIGKNAVDAMPDGGILSFGTYLENNFVALEVKDTGVGMSPGTAKQIFNPFFSTKETDRGTGLGLSISRRIVTDHQGRIEVKSDLGGGTTVSIFLPLTRRKQ